MNIGPISSLCLLIGIIAGIVLLVIGFIKVLKLYKNKFNFNMFPYTFCMLISVLLLGAASEQSGGWQALLILTAFSISISMLYFDIKRTNLLFGILAFALQICMIFMFIFILMFWLFSSLKNRLENKFGIQSLLKFFK